MSATFSYLIFFFNQVAAIFKIANSKDFPEIPNNLSEDVQSFIKLCLQRDPTARPTAVQLLQHPIVQHQSMVEAAKINVVEALTSSYGRKYMV